MITVTQKPITEPERKQLDEWLRHPGCEIYKRVLASGNAELLAQAANRLEQHDQNSRADSKLISTQARGIMAALDMLRLASAKVLSQNELAQPGEKPETFYTVELSNEPTE